jgi:hypothetical protein
VNLTKQDKSYKNLTIRANNNTNSPSQKKHINFSTKGYNMTIKKSIAIIALTLAFSPSANAKNLEKPPSFKDYPVKISQSKNKSVTDFGDYENFKTRIEDAMQVKPNVAGKYIVTGWGCGGGCHSYVLMNKESGKVLPYNLGSDSDYDIDEEGTKPESKLIVLRKKDTAYFNLLENDKLTLIGTMPAVKDKDISEDTPSNQEQESANQASAMWSEVIAEPNLVVRSKPNVSGEKLGNIPHGGKVKIIEKTNKNDSIGGRDGTWVKIEWQDTTAYAFDAFLKAM